MQEEEQQPRGRPAPGMCMDVALLTATNYTTLPSLYYSTYNTMCI